MNGLRQGDMTARVRCDAGDEFGELAHAFNQMVEDLQEVQMAKSVQDALIPAGRLLVPGFDALVVMERASELSGDYVDAVELSDGRRLFVTGDVSGQGTSAALAMAMAKSLVVQAADEGGDPVSLLEQIDRTLFRLLEPRRLLFFTAARLDPATGTVELSCAGAPYPVILRNDGRRESLRMPHLPLVATARPTPFPRLVAGLDPGDMLVMLTDGMIRNLSPEGEPFGLDNFERALESAPRNDAEAIAHHLMTAYRAATGPGAHEDDLSLLVLRRRSGPDDTVGLASPPKNGLE